MAELRTGFVGDDSYQGGYVAIGNFDGVHRGHQSMVGQLVSQARRANVPAVVLTFDPHPIRLLRPEKAPPSLTTIRHKAELLGRYGIDFVIAYPTNRDLLNLTPREFFDGIVVDRLKAKGLIEGPNFFFGRDRAGNVNTLQEYCTEKNMTLTIVEPVQLESDDNLVSSSIVRRQIATGEIGSAVDLLGHPYRLEGIVVQGAQRGRLIGFATANLSRIETLLPEDGVYGGHCVVDGVKYRAAINIGPNPTFAEDHRKVEVHLLEFDGQLYGSGLAVDLLMRIRSTQAFDSVESLTQQIQRDVQQIRSSIDV